MTEHLTFHTVDELEALPLDDLQALWELVPTERQKAYRAAYDREVRSAGAIGSDDLEAQVAAELLGRYRESALVPVGSRWAKTPQRVQAAARIDDLPGTETDAPTAYRPAPPVIAILGVIALVFVGLMLVSLLRDGDAPDPEATLTPSPTTTPEVSPTPTPLALEAQDEVITGGDSERTVAYPVNLQVMTDADAAPRVWVVQRRAVDAAEWNYDPNPDIASFVNGMSVRPVIGVPWSVDNAALFDTLNEGAVFTLTLNTGAILRYEFADKTEVRRSDTRAFRQVGPGLVLLLIGETDANGLPTAARMLVTATYPPEQELARAGQVIPLADWPDAPTRTPTPPPTDVPFAGMDVQIVSVTTQPGRLTIVLRLYNSGRAAQTVTPDDVTLALGHAPNPPGPRLPAEGMAPFTVLPGQAADVTLVWPWAGEPFAQLGVMGYAFGINAGGR